MRGLGSRESVIERLAATATGDPLDLLVVGGGITGAGIALDAAARGLSVGLVERLDFASGTSSKSSKLIHGGLRYLEQREFGLMREACTERDLLRRLAPHLVEPIPFVLPVAHRSARAKFGVGLWAYDALASFKNLKVHKHVEGAEFNALMPALPPGKVKGAYVFYDCKTDDVRLVMEVLIQAARYGAGCVNYSCVRDIDASSSGSSVCVEDSMSSTLFDVHARAVIAAGGVWADRIESLTHIDAPPRLRPSKGVHLLFSRDRFPVADAAAIVPDAERKRMLFVVPWHDSVLVGTSDTAYEGSLDHPAVEAEDRAYCLDAINSIYRLDLSEKDIAGAYAGLRPLIAGKRDETADLSRRHAVYTLGPGVLGITGGKMTTYRRMAKDAVDRAVDHLGGGAKSPTRWIRLGSSDVERLRTTVQRRARRLSLSEETVGHLVRVYGDRSLEVLDLAEEGLTEELVPGRAPIAAEAAYGARTEMVVQLNDGLARRTRLALLDPSAGIGTSAAASKILAAELGWSDEERARQEAAHSIAVSEERGLPLSSSGPAVPTISGAG